MKLKISLLQRAVSVSMLANFALGMLFVICVSIPFPNMTMAAIVYVASIIEGILVFKLNLDYLRFGPEEGLRRNGRAR